MTIQDTMTIQHYSYYPTNDTFACGIDALGRRSSRRDTNPDLTTCARCIDHREATQRRQDAKQTTN